MNIVNLQISNGRLPGIMKFEIKKSATPYLIDLNIWHGSIVLANFGDIALHNKKHRSYCECMTDIYSFDYHGFENAICGNIRFNLQRFIVIQMKISEEYQQKKQQMKEMIKQKREIKLNEIKEKVKNKENYFNKLEEWTGLSVDKLLFDSSIDNLDQYYTHFNKNLIRKNRLMFIIEDTTGEIFGYYINSFLTHNYGKWRSTDSYSFQFNLQSNGRLEEPMKFEHIITNRGGYMLQHHDHKILIRLGNIVLYKTKRKNRCYIDNDIKGFEYHGIDKALCGRSGPENPFKLQRLIVLQMN